MIERLESPAPAIDRPGGVARLLVELDPATSCRQCARGQGCGAGLLAASGHPVRLVVLDRLGAMAGETVRIESTSNSRWLRVIAVAYGLPTLGLLAGAILPRIAGIDAQWVAALSAALGLVVALVLWRVVIEPRFRSDPLACGLDGIETIHTVSCEPAEVS